jgi:hypothetical protein
MRMPLPSSGRRTPSLLAGRPNLPRPTVSLNRIVATCSPNLLNRLGLHSQPLNLVIVPFGQNRFSIRAIAAIGCHVERSEEAVAAVLLDAHDQAQALFSEIRARELIRPGITAREINAAVYDLAAQMYGVTRRWHKRIVRAGGTTLGAV